MLKESVVKTPTRGSPRSTTAQRTISKDIGREKSSRRSSKIRQKEEADGLVVDDGYFDGNVFSLQNDTQRDARLSRSFELLLHLQD
jgi:hypothetical protein